MRVLCIGSRSWMDFELVHCELERIKYECNEPITIVYDGEKGAGKMSAFIAQRLGYRISKNPPEVRGDVKGNILSLLDTKPDRVYVFHNNGSSEYLKLADEAKRRGLRTKVVIGY